MIVNDVVDRLDAKPSGRDRWRARCPSCGGDNASKVSIGIGDNDAVLLHCFAGCEVDAIVAAIGLSIEDLFPPRDASASPLRRRRMLSAGQALDLLHSETAVAFVVIADVRANKAVSDEDWQRFTAAFARIDELRAEVAA